MLMVAFRALPVVLACWLGSAAAAGPAPAARIPVTVVKVSDGDTLQVREMKHSIRIASMDSPELGHGRDRPGQPYAQASRKALLDLVGRSRAVEAVCYERDRYDRHICDLFVDGESVSRTLVGMGMAWANEAAGGRYLRDRQLLDLQRKARAEQVGLWAAPGQTPPWEWRSACWRDGHCQD
ncbi:thermonuclease family protein [Paracidovorax wautersii]|uniref:Endonuclease YncB, thermonuclease family n=1 Tax=Paracidovorax wautersii TaxID=1177982 RepID=A0A1I2HWU4_9BURK|nr:thermonuclease family protein [Paracidovorax wautersii]SFF34489.1 Endonuclease YncB, thermonuclease family [Paracidovorax wautersii]